MSSRRPPRKSSSLLPLLQHLPLAAVLLIAQAGCASAPGARATAENNHADAQEPDTAPAPTGLRDPADDPLVLAVDITERVAQDRWHVRYTLPEGAHGLCFVRDRNRFRAATWTPLHGARWLDLPGCEALLAADERSNTIELEFDSDLENKTADYNLNFDFSDGGRLLYTGHLVAVPFTCEPPDCSRTTSLHNADTHLAFDWTFHSAPERGITLLELRARPGAPLAWRQSLPQRSSGTFVYFGALEPLDAGPLTLVIDPGLPPWLAERTRDLMPRLFEHYRQATGVELPFEPLVLLSFGGGTQPGASLKGGTLEGLVQLDASGQAWLEPPSDDTETLWLHFLSHESFHLWNNQMFRVRGGQSHEWLSEGSAEYMALAAARQLDLIDEDTLTRRLVDSANRCLARLDGVPLMAAPFHGRYAAYYACGPLLFAWLEHRARRPGDELREAGRILSTLFARSDVHSRTYSTWDLLALLEAASGDPLAAAPLLEILQLGLTRDGEHRLQSLLAELHVATERVDVDAIAPDTVDPTRAIAQLLDDCDCGSRRALSLRLDDDTHTLTLSATQHCATLADVTSLSRVAGQDLSDPRHAHRALRHALADGQPVDLHTAASPDAPQRLELRCTDPAWRPGWRQLLAVSKQP